MRLVALAGILESVPSRPAERLAALISSDDASLDRLCAAVATIDRGAWSEDRIVDALDEMADQLGPRTDAEDLLAGIFGALGFTANRTAYYAPENSLIHRAIDRRKAIPLTLATVAHELGRRVGVPMSVVGMPGHALIGDGPDPRRWFDPFGGGRALEANDCERIFSALLPNGRFAIEMLAPIAPVDVIARMLQNLRAAYLRTGDLGQLAAVLHLRTALPTAPVEDRVELANVLAVLGREDQAAEQRDLLATLQPHRADEHATAATAHRARRN